jgi:peptidyl-prolyl cis-trans isomerase A (cyclophilin A)
MKAIVLTIVASCALFAQAPPKAPAKKSTAPAAKAPAVKSAPAPPASGMNPAVAKAKAPEVFKALFTTTKGDFTVEVHREWAPIGADRFYNLVKSGFFYDASFFRVVPGFVVQFGMHAKPSINKLWDNANLKDEPVKQSNKKGYLCFAAKPIPNTRTTQVFINLGDNAGLDGQGFAPFGMVTEGMPVVESLYSGYGDNGPDQGKIAEEGKVYLDKSFPKLDSIKTAKVLPGATPAEAPAKTAPAKTAPTKTAPTKTTVPKK